MPSGEGSGPKRIKGEGELTFEQALARLDLGYKEMRGGKLYLAQESGTVMGAIPFDVAGAVITGPDGTEFDLNHMNYGGENGLYAYLKRMAGTEDINSWKSRVTA